MYVSAHQRAALSKAIESLATPCDSAGLRQKFVYAVADLLNADYVASFVWDESSQRFTAGVSNQDDTQRIATYQAVYQFEDPIAPKLRPLHKPTRVSQVIEQQSLVKSEFFERFLADASMYWGMNVFAHDGQADLGDLRIWRAQKKADFTTDETQMMQLLYPSLVSALSNTKQSKVIDLQTTLSARFHLSPRECEVVILVAQGAADKVIAKRLNIAFSTVRTYLASAFEKLGQPNRKALITFVTALH